MSEMKTPPTYLEVAYKKKNDQLRLDALKVKPTRHPTLKVDISKSFSEMQKKQE